MSCLASGMENKDFDVDSMDLAEHFIVDKAMSIL